jgi:hypothetical protein
MPEIDRHLTDEELLRAADGELDSRQAEHVRQHLLSCWECRTRTSDMEASIAEFVHLHHATLDARIPPADGPRSMLKVRLAELANGPSRGPWWHIQHSGFSAVKTVGAVAILCVVGIVAGMAWRHRLPRQLPLAAFAVRNPSLPDRQLTPGSFQPVRLQDVCSAKSYEQASVSSVSLKKKVLEEYGMPATAASDHEIDFLVIPELGGTEDIRNLWPEPYSSTVWNAHVKDELEERLRNLVCEQKLDLATAQRDIAADWISAYKKYFHTDTPVPPGHTS